MAIGYYNIIRSVLNAAILGKLDVYFRASRRNFTLSNILISVSKVSQSTSLLLLDVKIDLDTHPYFHNDCCPGDCCLSDKEGLVSISEKLFSYRYRA